jgi:hypothetical protein
MSKRSPRAQQRAKSSGAGRSGIGRQKAGIKGMKLVAIKQECYAISGAATTQALKRQYVTLCRGLDFRTRKAWEYLLKKLREGGDWMGVRVYDLEAQANSAGEVARMSIGGLSFSPERVEMDRAAESDD